MKSMKKAIIEGADTARSLLEKTDWETIRIRMLSAISAVVLIVLDIVGKVCLFGVNLCVKAVNRVELYGLFGERRNTLYGSNQTQ